MSGTFVPDAHTDGFVPDPQVLPSHATPPKKHQVRAGNVLNDFLHGFGSDAGAAIGKAMDLLSRPGEAGAALAGGRGLGAAAQSFVHGETPEQYQQDTVAAIHRVPGMRQFYDAHPGIAQTATRFGADMLVDPTTYLGGAGLLKNAGLKIAEHALPAAVRGGRMLEDAAARLGPRAEEHARSVTEGVAGAFDRAVPGGALKRSLAAAKPPKEGARLFANAYASRNVAHRTASELTSAAHAQLDKVVEGLSPKDEHRLYVAINSGALYKLPKALRAKAAQFREITDSLAYLMGNKQLRAQIASQAMKSTPFELPQWAKPFDTEVRGLMKLAQYRRAYVPLTHDARFAQAPSEVEQDLTRRLATRRDARTLSERSPNLLPRQDLGLTLRDPQMQRDVIRRALASEARAIGAQDAKRSLSRAFGVNSPTHLPTELTHFLEQESKWDLGRGPKFVRGMVDIPKQGMFYLPFRHMTNIGFLGALHYPEALPRALATYRNLLAHPNDARNILKMGRAAGVAQMHSVDRNLGFARGVEKYAGMLGKPGALAGKVAAAPYRWSNKVLWAWDDAVKDAAVKSAVKRYLRQGYGEKDALALAGKEVNDRLVDYSTRSDLTKLAGYVAPFATWRTKLPGSIARGVAEHPERILAMQRANPALTGSQIDAPTSGAGAFTKLGIMNPITDTFELGQHPMRYARSTLSYPYQALWGAADALESQAQGDKHRYLYGTYGTNPAQWLLYGGLRSFPGMNELLEHVPLPAKSKNGKRQHVNPFAPQDPRAVQDFLLDLLGGQSGIYLERPRKP